MSPCTIRLCPQTPGPVISPNIYGHFAEHAGRCIYEGIWVGPRSKIPNENGLRLDVLAALKQLRAPVIRWPGGCFAATYHWRDGVGPADQRPQTPNFWSQQAEPNSFGTLEFLQFCSAAASTPYISLNVGSGSVHEALQWLEFCNHGGDTSITRLRSGPPHGVRYWGVGTAPWGCGGGFSPAEYAVEYKRYATYLRAADPAIELLACGCSPAVSPIWNYEFCRAMPHPDLIHHLTIQRYFTRGHGQTFSDSEYHALFGDLVALERDLDLVEHVLTCSYPDRHIGIAIDEFGLRHPQANVDNGFEQPCTLRDAVFAGATLNLFNRHAARVTMANLAQAINVFQSIGITEGARMVLTPTYYVYDMMRYHMESRAVMTQVGCDCYAAQPAGLTIEHRVPHLSASASISGTKVLLTVANQTVDHDVEARIEISGAKIAAAVGRMLNSASPRDSNTFEMPKTVFPKRFKLDPIKGELGCVFPAHSFTSLNLSLS